MPSDLQRIMEQDREEIMDDKEDELLWKELIRQIPKSRNVESME